MNYEYWMNMPLIQISNRDLQEFLGLRNNYASYNDFIAPGSGYKLQGKVEQAYNTPPGKQSKFDKAVIKADERMNICYSIFSGRFLKMFPVPESEDHQWHPSHETAMLVTNSEDSAFLTNILPVYFQELEKAAITGKYQQADEYLGAIGMYQQKYAGYELPTDFKIGLEVAYYKWNIFKKLFPFYTTVGVIFLFILIGGIISGKGVSKKVSGFFYLLILAAFIMHAIGLAARWYISGHAPMSNGYESLIFISFITLLAGLVFSRQSLLALSATAVLGGFTLMVANLSFMDPEITNLVPVLKSYWLTIHVSVITGSYGFLGLGAILGIINLVLTLVQNKRNYERIDDAINSLSKINHRTLILGVYFLTIGTFLGAVWANESWGRYWGWDPKETWSLITVLIYTLVTHARMVPGLKGTFAFNTLSVFAFFSVLMTYFGVNYYLSGLHSYAAGDPVPVPNFVYISVISIIALSIGAYLKLVKNNAK
jgi:cytochrome c-type biogenesis protein CcsB